MPIDDFNTLSGQEYIKDLSVGPFGRDVHRARTETTAFGPIDDRAVRVSVIGVQANGLAGFDDDIQGGRYTKG